MAEKSPLLIINHCASYLCRSMLFFNGSHVCGIRVSGEYYLLDTQISLPSPLFLSCVHRSHPSPLHHFPAMPYKLVSCLVVLLESLIFLSVILNPLISYQRRFPLVISNIKNGSKFVKIKYIELPTMHLFCAEY